MKRLTAKEFFKWTTEFFDKHEKYVDEIKTTATDETLSYEQKRETVFYLKKKYEGFVDISLAEDFFTTINDEYVELSDSSDVNAKILLDESKKYVGKRVIYSGDGQEGILKEIIATGLDYYYVIEIDGKPIYFSCVGSIKLKQE